jgi:hypothetical protein
MSDPRITRLATVPAVAAAWIEIFQYDVMARATASLSEN